MISFVQEFEGVDFLGAIKILADKAGITLSFDGVEEKGKAEKLRRILSLARAYYEAALTKKTIALGYLRERGLTDESITAFGIGYAPHGWHYLYDALLGKGQSAIDMEEAGLLVKGREIKNNRTHYDRFRGRIMFPLNDAAGNPVGFTGRLAPDNDADKDMGKYINTPETILYHKSKFLYGFDRAKTSIRKEGAVILVEGQFDVIMAHQVGFTNTVAVSGTALTEDHLTLLSRLTNTILVAFDGDIAGQKASGKANTLALSMGLVVKAISMEKGEDPADCIRRDKEEWGTRVRGAEPIIDALFRKLTDECKDKVTLRTRVENEILPYVASLKSSIERAQYAQRAADVLVVPLDAVMNTLASTKPLYQIGTENTDRPKASSSSMMTRDKESRKHELEDRIAGIMMWQREERIENFPYDELYAKFCELTENRALELTTDDDTKKAFIASVMHAGGGEGGLERSTRELLSLLEDEIVGLKMQKLLGEIKWHMEENEAQDELGSAEQKVDQKIGDRLEEMQRRYEELSRRRHELRHERTT